MKVLLGVAALVLLAGCSSSGAAQKPSSPTPSPELDSAAAIGKIIGCRTPLRIDTQSTAQEERYCKVGNQLVSIVRASDRRNLMTYAQMGEAFGANVALVNDHWGISSLSRSTVQRLASRNHWQML